MDIRNFVTALETAYPLYQIKGLETPIVKHKDILPLIEGLKEKELYEVKIIGKSLEERDIYKISLGQGKENMLIWSQMHGNESTGTRAIFDVLNYFYQNRHKNFVQDWFSLFRFHFIPMLNPDGAERYTRRNAMDIDLNRDAQTLQCPESQLLTEWRDVLQARWAFNLHDQIPHYSAGLSNNPASISFLVPAYNQEEDIDESRGNGMQLIALLNRLMSPYIPNLMARYWSTYSARCFGETFQTKGTNCLLIESGTYPFEQNKETPRKINFMMLLAGFEALFSNIYESETIESYHEIPVNRKNFYNLIIQNVKWKKADREIIVDIAVNYYEEPNETATEFITRSEIMDIGDLSTEYAYLHYDAREMHIKPALKLPESYEDLSVIFPGFSLTNFQKGYLLFPLKGFDRNKRYDSIDFKVVSADYEPAEKIKIGNPADFYLEKDGKIAAIVVNGDFREL